MFKDYLKLLLISWLFGSYYYHQKREQSHFSINFIYLSLLSRNFIIYLVIQ